jgi:hypothetical protein
MKTDDGSGEADEPPAKKSDKPEKSIRNACEENEELQGARGHVSQDPAHQPESRPASANTEPAAQAVFRKTELRDRPPLFRSEEPVLRQNTLLNLQGPDAEVPYGPFEDALRNLTSVIVRRQEAIAQRLAGQADELHDRLDAPEDRLELTIDRIDRRISRLEEERES